MLRNRFSLLALFFAVAFLSDQAWAQRGGGPRGGGSGMCSRSNGGSADSTPTGNNITDRQTLFRRQQMSAQQNNRSNAVNSIAAASQLRANSAAFVRSAMEFDSDQNGELNEAELNLVAAALVKDLQSRHPQFRNQNQNSNLAVNSTTFRTANPATSNRPQATTEQLAADFVVKALSYDRDGDKSLNSRETRIMATAFIRTLG